MLKHYFIVPRWVTAVERAVLTVAYFYVFSATVDMLDIALALYLGAEGDL